MSIFEIKIEWVTVAKIARELRDYTQTVALVAVVWILVNHFGQRFSAIEAKLDQLVECVRAGARP